MAPQIPSFNPTPATSFRPDNFGIDSEYQHETPKERSVPQDYPPLNEYAGTILNAMGRAGAYLEQLGLGNPSTPSSAKKSIEGATTAHQYTSSADEILRASDQGWTLGRTTQNSLQEGLGNLHLIEKDTTSGLEGLKVAGPYAKVLGGALDAVTGVANVLVAVHHDQTRGDASYRETLRESLLSTGQILVGAGVGYGAAAAAGALAFSAGTIAVPVAIGVGVGIGASYAAGKIMDLVRSVW